MHTSHKRAAWGQAKSEVIALWTEISTRILAGTPVTVIYRDLVARGCLSCSEQSFQNLVCRFRKAGRRGAALPMSAEAHPAVDRAALVGDRPVGPITVNASRGVGSSGEDDPDLDEVTNEHALAVLRGEKIGRDRHE